MKEIIAVYQDCVFCGDKGRKKIARLAKNGIQIRKVGFTTEEGKELIRKAVFGHGIKSMPFYVCGDEFAPTLGEFLIPKEPKIVKKVRKKAVQEKKAQITNKDAENVADKKD